MKRFRDVLFWAHLITGLFVGIVVLIMSVTGVLLTYQRQITAWADTRGLDGGPPTPGAEKLPVDILLARVVQAEPGRPTSLRWHDDPNRPVEVAYGRGRTVYVNAYTGEVLGDGNSAVRAFFQKMVSWHRWLGAEGENRALGRAITGACNLGFLFLVLSGVILWIPRNRTARAFRNVTFFRRGLSGKARDFNWHNVIGVWSAIPLVIVVASGVVISYPWASNLVYRLAGEEPPAAPARGAGGAGQRSGSAGGGGPVVNGAAGGGPGGGVVDGRAASRPADRAPRREQGAQPERAVQPDRVAQPPVTVLLAGVDALVERAESRLPGWRSITLQIPGSATDPVTFTIDRGDGGQPQKRAQLVLDRATGDEVKWETFADNSRGRRARSILRFAHTGEVAGIVGQTIAGLVTAGSVVLVWTGIALAIRRCVAWLRRRSRATAAGAETAPGEPELVHVN